MYAIVVGLLENNISRRLVGCKKTQTEKIKNDSTYCSFINFFMHSFLSARVFQIYNRKKVEVVLASS
jgi:hypothetical protein